MNLKTSEDISIYLQHSEQVDFMHIVNGGANDSDGGVEDWFRIIDNQSGDVMDVETDDLMST